MCSRNSLNKPGVSHKRPSRKRVTAPEDRVRATGTNETEQRRRDILTLMRQQGFVQTRKLSEHLSISGVSVRKDLSFLERKGLIKRVHGGAKLADDATSLLDFSERYMVNRTAKERISRRAVELLDKPGLQIYIDTGTTNLLLARAIPANLPITVVTNSFSTIAALEGRPACRVVTLGGEVDYHRKVSIGPWADGMLDAFRFDFLFAGADSVDAEGFGCDDILQNEILRKAIARARAFYVLGDSSKVFKRARSVYAKCADATAWITDSKLDPSFAKAFKAQGGRIVVAD